MDRHLVMAWPAGTICMHPFLLGDIGHHLLFAPVPALVFVVRLASD